jgi:uncharacterized membrane protein
MKRSLSCTIAVALAATSAHAQITFELLPLASPMRNANGRAGSDDASVVVGVGNGPFGGPGLLSYVWSPAQGSILVPPLSGFTLVGASAVSGDGSVVVGMDYLDNLPVMAPYAWSWTSGGAPEALPFPPETGSATAFGVSQNGSTVVGWVRLGSDPNGPFRATVWRNGTVTTIEPPEPYTNTAAGAVSADGSVVVGSVYSSAPGDSYGFRWSADAGIEILTGPARGALAIVGGVSPDGRTVVGAADYGINGIHAVRWHSAGAPEDLGAFPGSGDTQALAVSADGRITVGYYQISGFSRAFLSSPQTGIVDLTQFLTSRGVDLQGWSLETCTTITPDGNWLIGSASNPPNGVPWRAHIPGLLCYANCDASTSNPALDVNDFVCFMQHFAAADDYANCDQSTTPPVVNVADFVCFQQHFAAGCP